MSIFLIPWFAFWRRFYGAAKGDFPLNRVIGYAVPLALSVAIAFPVSYNPFYQIVYQLALVLAFWLGMSAVSYAEYWNMKTPKDWLMMGWNGFLLMLPVGVLLLFKSITFGCVIGLCGAITLPIGYWLGWKMPTVNQKYLNKGTEWGEILSGVIIGLFFFAFSILE